jgi:hypothetical protein
MNKRKFIVGTGAVAATAVAAALPAEAKVSGSASFVVPFGVKRIRVRSYNKGEKVLDRSLNVMPGQTFIIDPIQGG